MYDRNNIFAKILRGEIPCKKIYESEHALAFEDIHPKAPVHVLVVPKGEYVSLQDFSLHAPTAAVKGFFDAVAAVAKMLGVDKTGYRAIANHGADASQEVPHFHVHIIGGRKLGKLLPE
ncbi:MAG: HIT domain-containing protein [Pseudomonadota bacterium]|nr:HIT domain-containing protein [Pseudomonadota bacterium]